MHDTSLMQLAQVPLFFLVALLCALNDRIVILLHYGIIVLLHCCTWHTTSPPPSLKNTPRPSLWLLLCCGATAPTSQFVAQVDSEGDETPSQPAVTPAASSHAAPQESAPGPSEASRGTEVEAPYVWQNVEGVVRVWAQQWLDFDEQGVESNSSLFDSLSKCVVDVYCPVADMCTLQCMQLSSTSPLQVLQAARNAATPLPVKKLS